MRILVIEDDDRTRAFTSSGLRQDGHVVDDTADGEDGLRLWLGRPYDGVVLDLNLASGGLSLLRAARQRGDLTPTIIVSARNTVDERIEGLRSGADDYLAKPFSFSELLARIGAIVSRQDNTEKKAWGGGTLSLSGITLDFSARRVTRDGCEIPLKPKEFALLGFLMRNPNRPLTKEVILHQVWDYRFNPQSNIVDALICRLRSRLDASAGESLIETRRGVGYVFHGRP